LIEEQKESPEGTGYELTIWLTSPPPGRGSHAGGSRELRDDRGPAEAAVYVVGAGRVVYGEFSFREIREQPVSVGVVAIKSERGTPLKHLYFLAL